MDAIANRRRILCGPKMKCDRRRMRAGCTEGRAMRCIVIVGVVVGGVEQNEIEYNFVYFVSVNGCGSAIRGDWSRRIELRLEKLKCACE